MNLVSREVFMKLSYLVLASLIATLMFFVGVTPATAQKGRIQGKVVDEAGTPLQGVQISTEAGDRQPAKNTVTGDDGRFTFIGFASGRVTVNASLEGYGPSSATITVNQGSSPAMAELTLLRARSGFELMVGDDALEGQDTAQLEAGLQAANAAFDAEDYDAAITGYGELLAVLPSLGYLHLGMGNAYRANGDMEMALASYENLLGHPEHGQQAEVEIARTRLAMGDLDAAAGLATAGVDTSREDLYNLGEVDFVKGNVDSAAGWYEKAAAAAPDWEKPWFKLALVALNKGDMDTAKQHFQKVVDLAPNSEEGAQAQATLSALP